MDICSTRRMREANCGTDHQMLRSRVIFSIMKKKTQSERSYETCKVDHKQTEKYQPREEYSAGNGQGTRPIMGI